MIKKNFFLGIILFMLVMPGLVFAQPPSEASPSPEKDAQSLLSAFMSYTDLRIGSVQRSLEILASTAEGKSGKWESMKGLLSGYQKSEDGLIVWYARPDGTYDTADKGLMNVKLSDRSYFPDLMAGMKSPSRKAARSSARSAHRFFLTGSPIRSVPPSIFGQMPPFLPWPRTA